MERAKDWEEMRGSIFDSRDVIARLAELNSAAEEEPNDFGCSDCGEGSSPSDAFPALCVEHGDELTILRQFEDEQYAEDWQYGTTFIPEYDFEDYARELAEDIGAIPSDAGWPVGYIDWPRAADALRIDYHAVEVDGTTYLYR